MDNKKNIKNIQQNINKFLIDIDKKTQNNLKVNKITTDNFIKKINKTSQTPKLKTIQTKKVISNKKKSKKFDIIPKRTLKKKKIIKKTNPEIHDTNYTQYFIILLLLLTCLYLFYYFYIKEQSLIKPPILKNTEISDINKYIRNQNKYIKNINKKVYEINSMNNFSPEYLKDNTILKNVREYERQLANKVKQENQYY